MLVFLDLEARDLESAVLLQRQANRFRKFEMPDFGCQR
jgi:hypothetical protein